MTAVMLDRMVQHRTCEQCHHPINDQGLCLDTADANKQRGWIHTETEQYRCPRGTLGTFAFPDYSEDTLEAAREEAYGLGYDAAAETLYTAEELKFAREDAYSRGVAQGRADYSTELNGAITVALHTFIGSLTSASDTALIMRLNEGLTEAWESVTA